MHTRIRFAPSGREFAWRSEIEGTLVADTGEIAGVEKGKGRRAGLPRVRLPRAGASWFTRYEGSPYRRCVEGALKGLPELLHFGADTFKKVGPLGEHEHEGIFEICVMLRGRATWWVRDEEFVVHGGDIFVTWPNEPHGGVGGVMHPCTLYWLHLRVPRPRRSKTAINTRRSFLSLPPAEADRICAGLHVLPLRIFPGAGRCAPILSRMEDLYETGDPRNITALRAALQLFLCEILTSAEAAQREGEGQAVEIAEPGSTTGSGEKPQHVEPPGIRRAREFLDSCPLPWPKVPELAELAGMSLSHFHACFARETGMAPLAYAHLVRLEQARRLLRRKGATVTRVAVDLGYCSGQHLAGVFRRYLGITPTQAVEEGAG